MSLRNVTRLLGHIIRILGLFFIPVILIAAFTKESAWISYALIAAILVVLGTLCTLLRPHRAITAREGFLTVALGWIVISLAGALPFFVSGAIPSFLDCWFETASGFSTTGASILSDVESLPMSLLYWRSFSNWLGGMGVLVFLLAVVPLSQSGAGDSFQLMRAESPGPSVGKITPTLRSTARILYLIYIGLTALEIVLLMAGGMPFFDSLNCSLSTAGTGGFSIKNASLAAYPSPYLQIVTAVFMLLFGVNFNVFYLILIGRARSAFKNEELRAYLAVIIVSTAVIFLNILSLYESAGKALLDSFFQVSSIITTTGFSTADFNLWPSFSKGLILLLMVVGACAGSTGGGTKISRVLILLKSARNGVRSVFRPRDVRPVMMDGKAVDQTVISGVHSYYGIYFVICALSFLLVSIDGFDLTTTVSAVFSCLNNIGPGLEKVGPTANYSALSVLSKIVLTLDMLIGRLEIFPMLTIFSVSAWKR